MKLTWYETHVINVQLVVGTAFVCVGQRQLMMTDLEGVEQLELSTAKHVTKRLMSRDQTAEHVTKQTDPPHIPLLSDFVISEVSFLRSDLGDTNDTNRAG